METEEQRLLAEAAAGWLRRHYGFDRRAALLAGHDGRATPLWQEFSELGWLALPLPERLGGFAADVAPLMQEFGRALVCEPYVATVLLGAGMLAACGDLRHDTLAVAAGEGRRQLALAFDDAAVPMTAQHADAGWRLDGGKTFVLNGDAADVLLVTAHGEDGLSLFAVPRDAAGLTATGYRCFDGHRAAEIALRDCRLPAAALVGQAGAALPPLRRTVERATAGILAEALGAMEAALALTTAHLRTRRQFGRRLADFQVLRHRLVEMWMATEEARSMAHYAAEALAWPEAAARARAIAAAKQRIAVTGRFVGQQAIQLHGAIGLTAECAAGHYAARLESLAGLFGDADHHLALFDQGEAA
jgi:alkylation response protein AidB-like acyl-CoA dehydrogenase